MEDTTLLSSMLTWKASHVKRVGNQVARCLAKQALKLVDTTLVEEVTDLLSHLWLLIIILFVEWKISIFFFFFDKKLKKQVKRPVIS